MKAENILLVFYFKTTDIDIWKCYLYLNNGVYNSKLYKNKVFSVYHIMIYGIIFLNIVTIIDNYLHNLLCN